jgi:uncharacterized delta-60 repeat protein
LPCKQPNDRIKEGWVARDDGEVDSWDSSHALTLDSKGNIIVTGSAPRSGTGSDYLTIKYDATGKRLWTAFYAGPDRGSDSAAGVATDSQDNIYVTGSSDGPWKRAYATVKYSPAGEEIWVRRFEGSAGEDDFATAIAIDINDNVYVTGSSGVTSSDRDYVTLKYDPDGQELWAPVRYKGPAGANDEAVAIAVDAAGHVYVTGKSKSDSSGYDFATVKYGANGKELWVARYDGPAHGDDVPAALALDGQGNVIVTGRSQGSESGLDFATLKYSPGMQEIWLRRFNGPVSGDDEPSALAMDAAGNVHITGRIDHLFLCTDEGRVDRSAHPGDYGTLKYDAAGNLLWLARYEGAERSSSAFAKAITLDGAGNVYVTGVDDHFFECDIEQEPTEDNYATIKYSPRGEELWIASYDGPEHLDDGAAGIRVDSLGKVYVTGQSGSTSFSLRGDIATIQYLQK